MEALGNYEVLADTKGHSTGPEAGSRVVRPNAHAPYTYSAQCSADGKKVAVRPPTEHHNQRHGQVLHCYFQTLRKFKDILHVFF